MGYVVEREGRWYAVAYEGLDPLTGADRRRWHRAPDRAAAQLLVAELASRPRRGPLGLTLARYLRTRWLPARQARLKPTTHFRYRAMVESYILPHLGRVPLGQLNARHLERLYASLLDHGAVDGGALAAKTVLNVHQILRKALGDAMRAGLIVRNVALSVDPPRGSAASEQRCWDEAQLRWFLARARDYRLYPALWLAAATGMRRGEVIALRWSDVDLADRRLAVRRSASCAGYAVHVTTNKTPTSRRSIDLDDQTVSVLEEWQARQRAKLGRTPETVFTTTAGRPVHPQVLSQCFESVIAAAGLDRIRFHDLRHTHASLLLKARVPLKVVSERLGHSSPAFTMVVYQHVLPGMQRDAADLFGRLVRPTRPTPTGTNLTTAVSAP